MLAYLGLYLALGIMSITVLCLIHVVVAECRKYNAIDYWKEAFPMIEKRITPCKLAVNLLIWPVRLIQIAAAWPMMYDVYQYNQHIRRTK